MRITVTPNSKTEPIIVWGTSVDQRLTEMSSENEELQTKVKGLQTTLHAVVQEQQKYQQTQQSSQKQLATLRSQIAAASNAEDVETLSSQVKALEAQIAGLKAPVIPSELNTQLAALQQEYRSIKANTEQLAKMSSSLRAQLGGVIADSERQAQQCATWQEEYKKVAEAQSKGHAEALMELQEQLGQTKMVLSKRLVELERRLGGLEKKHSQLETRHDSLTREVKGQTPEYTVVQKLLKLRQIVLEDKFIQDELKQYVAPNGEPQPGSTVQTPLYEWVQANFLNLNSEVRVLLLQGQAGAGKSTFNRFLLKQLWQDKAWEGFKPGDKVPPVYIPLFVPLGSQRVNPAALLQYLIDLPELTEDFTDAEINILKRDYRLLLIVDGYDEMPYRQALNLYDVNELDQYEGRFKLLIGCRTQRAQELDQSITFVPHDKNGKPRHSEFSGRHISAFNETQIRDYLTQYLAANRERTDITLWKNAKDYEEAFTRIPEIKALITTPYLLLMSIEVLPSIMSELTTTEYKRSDTQQLTRAKLYDYFMESWFKRQAEKARKMGDTTPPKLLMQRYRQFCLKFAERLRAAGITSVQYPYGDETLFDDDLLSDKPKEAVDPEGPQGPWVKKLLGTENDAMVRARQGAPLLIATGNYYQFIHASLIDYFLTTSIYQARAEGVIAPSITPETGTAKVPTAQSGQVKVLNVAPAATIESLPSPKSEITKAEVKQIPELTPDNPDVMMQQQMMTRDQWELLADRVETTPSFKDYLFQLIHRSKSDAHYAIAAANAISILNIARVSFSGMDFTGIKIPGADLSYSILDNTQLKDADLSHVSLQFSWLRQTNFSGAKMYNVQFGEWPYLELTRGVSCICYSHDGLWMAVACYGSSSSSEESSKHDIYIFDAKTHKQIHFLKLEKYIYDLAFDERCERLISVCKDMNSKSEDISAHVWDITTGTCEKTIKISVKNKQRGFELNAKGECFATTTDIDDFKLGRDLQLRLLRSKDKSSEDLSEFFAIHLWQTATGKLQQVLKGHTQKVNCIAFDSKGEQLASGSGKKDSGISFHENDDKEDDQDNTVRLWNVSTGKCEHIFNGHTEPVTSVTFDHKRERIASGSDDGTIRIWNVISKMCDQILPEEYTNSLVFDPKGKFLIVGGSGKIRFWNIVTGQCERIIEGHSGRGISTLVFDVTGECLTSRASDQSTIHFWQVQPNNKSKARLDKHINFSGENIIFDPTGKYLTFKNARDSVCLLHTLTGKCERQFKVADKTDVIAFDTKGEQLFLRPGEYDNKIYIWNVTNGKCEQSIEVGSDSSIAVDATRTSLALGIHKCKYFEHKDGHTSECNPLFLRHITKDTSERTLISGTPTIVSIAFDPKGKRLASKDGGRTIRIWDLASGTCERVLKEPTEESISSSILAFDAKGELLASTNGDSVYLWNVLTGKNEHILKEHNCVSSLAFEPKGKYLASGSWNHSIMVWDVATGKCCLSIYGFHGWVVGVAWTEIGKDLFLVAGSKFDWAVRLFQIFEDHYGKPQAILRWASHQAILTAVWACIEGVIDIDHTNFELLKQRHAFGTPATITSPKDKLEKDAHSKRHSQKDPTDIRGLAAPATRLGLLASPSPTSAATRTSSTTTEVIATAKR